MRTFTLYIESRTNRTVRIAAPDAQSARAYAGVLLRGNDRIMRVTDDDLDAPIRQDLAEQALERLRSRDYFDWQGQAQCVEDWLLRAALPGQRDKMNAILALAGLRVMPDGRVAIGSPSSVPTMHGWFRTTPFSGQALMHVLGGLPGAQRANFRFAGTASRAVILPFALVVPEETPVPAWPAMEGAN